MHHVSPENGRGHSIPLTYKRFCWLHHGPNRPHTRHRASNQRILRPRQRLIGADSHKPLLRKGPTMYPPSEARSLPSRAPAAASARPPRVCSPSAAPAWSSARVASSDSTRSPGEIRERGGTGRHLSRSTSLAAEDLERLVGIAVEEFGSLDVLVCNAGISKIGPVADLDVDGWSAMIDVNLRGVLHGIAAALPVFRRQGQRPLRDDRVHGRAQDRAHHGGLCGHQERRPHPHGGAAARVRPTACPDDVDFTGIRRHRTRQLHRRRGGA